MSSKKKGEKRKKKKMELFIIKLILYFSWLMYIFQLLPYNDKQNPIVYEIIIILNISNEMKKIKRNFM